MPELPEVEHARCLLNDRIVGRIVTDVIVTENGGGPRHDQFDDIVFVSSSVPSGDVFVKALKGQKCIGTGRRGKQMWLTLARSPDDTSKAGKRRKLPSLLHPLFHFGMTGSFVVRGVPAMRYKSFAVHDESWPPKFTKCEIGFDDGTRIAFCDPRRLGRIRLSPSPLEDPVIASLASDALLELPPLDQFSGSLAGPSVAIKALLLDQKRVLSGLGNWMVDEICFQARVHPANACSGLSAEQVTSIHSIIQMVVGVAVDLVRKGSSLPSGWLFHKRWGKGKSESLRIDGHPIQHCNVGGRTTAFVAQLQRVNSTSKKPKKEKKEKTSTKTINSKEGFSTKETTRKEKKPKKRSSENPVKKKEDKEVEKVEKTLRTNSANKLRVDGVSVDAEVSKRTVVKLEKRAVVKLEKRVLTSDEAGHTSKIRRVTRQSVKQGGYSF